MSVSSSVSRNAILVSNRQKENPLLKHIRNVRWVFADVVPDYLLGQSSCALYLRISMPVDIFKTLQWTRKKDYTKVSVLDHWVLIEGFHTCVGSGGERQTPEW
ncbi:DNA excision repair protein ERCC-1-like isoform X1 [Cucumis melo]|uniref:DNA excision repair protein ERCC-1-like isoform X1 n=1 Tax=Cucumis melo TaxID=3656 RepID=A0ABM3KYJ6_CUCME|nr:DNA excision repair protein ERCC-1-like isoform X1 [Cucumis melo]XP_050942854.1 DNA excision repair protein ERCC-1-like isoform X1 [Cucumis melo]